MKGWGRRQKGGQGRGGGRGAEADGADDAAVVDVVNVGASGAADTGEAADTGLRRRGFDDAGWSGPAAGTAAAGDIGHRAPEAEGPARKSEAKYTQISFESFPGFSENLSRWGQLRGENGSVILEAGLASRVLRQ